MHTYHLFGDAEVEAILSNDLYIMCNGNHELRTDHDINVNDYIYRVDNHFYEHVFQVRAKIIRGTSVYLRLSKASLTSICIYGSGDRSCDSKFNKDVIDCYNDLISEGKITEMQSSSDFHAVSVKIYDELQLNRLPFEFTCMVYRINHILSARTGIKWERPVFFEDF